MNDVGPFIPKAALARILDYVGKDPRFADLAAAEAYHRKVYSGFGALSVAQWRHLTETSIRPDGTAWRLHYDPRIAQPRSEEHTSELQSLMRISYAVFCLKNKTHIQKNNQINKFYSS